MAEKEYLTVAEALARVLEGVRPLAMEKVPLTAALGRVLASAVRAEESLPPFANSAMDGYAVRAEDVAAGSSRWRWTSPGILRQGWHRRWC